MPQEKHYVTQDGLDALIKEHDRLVHEVRAQVIVELQEARAQGDLSENADYDAAREHQAQVEARIAELDQQIKSAVIIDDDATVTDHHMVKLGSTVKIEDLSEKVVRTFKIVGSIEADPLNGKLSNNTPLAEAMMDKQAGDVVTVSKADLPYDVKILSVE